jgi:hypothetical protein
MTLIYVQLKTQQRVVLYRHIRALSKLLMHVTRLFCFTNLKSYLILM